jgi:hypothetical protein
MRVAEKCDAVFSPAAILRISQVRCRPAFMAHPTQNERPAVIHPGKIAGTKNWPVSPVEGLATCNPAQTAALDKS